MSAETVEVVFEGRDLRATLFHADAEHLFVSLRQRIDTPGQFDAPNPARSFVDHGFAHLHLQSRVNDWFINAETPALAHALDTLTGRYADVCGIGFSMGGYGLMRFAAELRLGRVMLVSPQMSIHPEVVPWDRRYRDAARGFDREMGDLARVATRPGFSGVVLFDPFRPLDRRHAVTLQRMFPGLALARLGCGGHPATRVIGQAGRFGALQRMLRDDRITAPAVTGLHRAQRRDAPIYWRHLAQRAEKSGRDTLAARALRHLDEAEAKKAGGHA